MNRRRLQHYIDDLLAGHRPTPFPADDFEADQIRTAIDLTAARPGADEPRPGFLADLHDQLAAQADDSDDAGADVRRLPRRRQVIVATSAAAAAAVAAVAVDRTLVSRRPAPEPSQAAADQLLPNDGVWQPVAASADVTADTMTRFEQDALVGFLRRVGGQVEAVSGVCTHQGCQLWFDRPDDRLRCPCHSTSFAPDGTLLTHQLPIAPKPLPRFQVRETDGVVEVLGPARPPTV